MLAGRPKLAVAASVVLTRTVSLHDGLWPWGPLSSFPRTGQLYTNMVACRWLQVHQGDGLSVTVDWHKSEGRLGLDYITAA